MTMNSVHIIGRLTADPVTRYTPAKQRATEFGFAINTVWTDQETGAKHKEVDFFDVVAWGRTGEIASQYLSKGRLVAIEGHLKQQRWIDRRTHKQRSRVKVIAKRLRMLDAPRQNGEDIPAELTSVEMAAMS